MYYALVDIEKSTFFCLGSPWFTCNDAFVLDCYCKLTLTTNFLHNFEESTFRKYIGDLNNTLPNKGNI